MKNQKRTVESVSDSTCRKLLRILRSDEESTMLAAELGKVLYKYTASSCKNMNMAEYARSIAIRILKDDVVAETVSAQCGRTIESMLAEAEFNYRERMIFNGGYDENDK